MHQNTTPILGVYELDYIISPPISCPVALKMTLLVSSLLAHTPFYYTCRISPRSGSETLQLGPLVFCPISSHLVLAYILGNLERKGLLDGAHSLEDTQPALSPTANHGLAIT